MIEPFLVQLAAEIKEVDQERTELFDTIFKYTRALGSLAMAGFSIALIENQTEIQEYLRADERVPEYSVSLTGNKLINMEEA